MKFTHDHAKKKLRFRDETWGDLVVLADDYKHPCPMCGKETPLELRQTATGVVYDQPRCGPCRRLKKGKQP